MSMYTLERPNGSSDPLFKMYTRNYESRPLIQYPIFFNAKKITSFFEWADNFRENDIVKGDVKTRGRQPEKLSCIQNNWPLYKPQSRLFLCADLITLRAFECA